MSQISFLLRDLLDNLQRPASLFDQNFGTGMLGDDLLHSSIVAPLGVGYCRPWRSQAAHHSGISHIQDDKDCFKVNLDVQQFKPEELTVKTVNDYVVVEGKHEERQDEHGFISRQFQRRYKLPADIEPDTVVSQLSSDGVLTVSAPKKALPQAANEKVVPITQTQAPALKPKSAKADEPQKMET